MTSQVKSMTSQVSISQINDFTGQIIDFTGVHLSNQWLHRCPPLKSMISQVSISQINDFTGVHLKSMTSQVFISQINDFTGAHLSNQWLHRCPPLKSIMSTFKISIPCLPYTFGYLKSSSYKHFHYTIWGEEFYLSSSEFRVRKASFE